LPHCGTSAPDKPIVGDDSGFAISADQDMRERRDFSTTETRINDNTMAESSERTPLLSGVQQVDSAAVLNGKDTRTAPRSIPWLQHLAVQLRDLVKVHVEKRILFAGFLITLSFSFTQVP
jgi:hypothetical protein